MEIHNVCHSEHELKDCERIFRSRALNPNLQAKAWIPAEWQGERMYVGP